MKRKTLWTIIIFSLLLLADCVHHAKVYRFCADIIGSPYVSSYCDTMFMQVFPLELRFWLHGCNTVEKLQKVGQKYVGVEMDVIYYVQTDTFGVSHDREEIVSLPLDNVIGYLATGKQKIWLDFKNFTDENQEASRNCLNKILARYQFDKSRIIVESNHWLALEFYTTDGFYTSYYCPVEDKKHFVLRNRW